MAAALALPGVLFVAVQAGTASDGAHLRPGAATFGPGGLVVSPLRPGAGPLREGDAVLAIGGVAVDDLVGRLLGGRSGSVDAEVLRDGWRQGAIVPYDLWRDGAPVRVEVELGRHPLAAAVARTWGTILFAFVNLIVVAFVFARRPDEPAVRVLFVGAGALLGATTWSLGLHVGDIVWGTGFWLFQATTVPVFMAYWSSLFHFAAIFPAPLSIARARGFVPAIYAGPLIALTLTVLALWSRASPPLDRWDALVPVSGVQAALFLGLALAALFAQVRGATARAGRDKIRWVVLAASVAGVAGLTLYLLPPLLGGAALSPNLMGVVATLFPVGVAVAVLHHKLFDIDTLINRTLLYGALSFSIGAGYVLVVTALGALFQARGELGPALIATGLVAVAFQPLRERLQRAVNRITYGERDDPAAILGRLGARLEGTLAPDDVLPTLAETVAEALRIPFVAIERHDLADVRMVAAYGRARHTPVRFPLAYRGEPIGDLLVEPRGPDEAFSPTEVALLETIARQASVAAYALRATDDLRRSRERLVAAREEERRRLRAELHDGLGPALGSMTLKLDAASNVLEREPIEARAMLEDLREQVEDAIADLRVVVHALRPPALDDLGLVGALRAHIRRREHSALRIEFHAPASLLTVPAAIEAAVYRIVQEGLTNVVRHAQAHRAWVTLTVTDGAVAVTVEDDGVGVVRSAGGGGARSGIGLESMRERTLELGGRFDLAPRPGGGTRLNARFPMADVAMRSRRGVARPPVDGGVR